VREGLPRNGRTGPRSVVRSTTSSSGPTRARRYGEFVTQPASCTVRPATPRDAVGIRDLVQPYANERILLAKELVGYYEAVPEFLVAVDDAGTVVGCGALHIMWSDLAEVRTLAVYPERRQRGIGHALLAALLDRARDYGLRRVFCLTFEVDFFAHHGFRVIDGTPVDPQVFAELLRSHDDGVAEFLDLAHVKPNTLGNTRMLLEL
jgi:amino-acid N-acetyltransferase